MKRSILLSWGMIIIVFVLAATGLAKNDVPQEEEWNIPDPGVSDSVVTIRVKLDETVQEMNLDEYLQGVLRAEMPASFELEALKAQAVAARTETMYKVENGPAANHPDADICNDINCCQAFKTGEAAKNAWGVDAQQYAAKIATAVRETDGMVILYENEPILAAFFSASSGQTNQAGDVWINDLPYLQSVESPEGENEVPNYYSVATFSEEEFKSIFLAEYPEADLSGAAENWFGEETRNDSDMVLTIPVGGVEVKGTKIRTMFSMKMINVQI